MASRNYQDLVAWQRAMDLAASVYLVARRLPGDERFGLSQQLRRAAVSVPSNIAEGQGRGSRVEFVRFLRIAYASLREIETQLLLAERLRYASGDDLRTPMDLTAEVGRLLNGLMRSQQ